MTAISDRKADHIDLCATGDVAFRQKTTLFEEVELVHDALPELSVDEIDTSLPLFGKKLSAPIFIAAMTGGTDKAREINRELARIADKRGYGFGLGSQRAMVVSGSKADTYEVRDVAPDVLVLGNIGVVQARSMASDAVSELAKRVGADAICVHMNPAMELVQREGDRHFRGALGALERLAADLTIPVVAKETGCGIGPSVAARLAEVGVRHLDVSGAGGTSWVAVETERASGTARTLGEALREWGVPTAASIVVARGARPRFKTIIATGGVSTGLEIAKAIALGATAAGIARPVLQAFTSKGAEGVVAFLDEVEAELRAVMLLVGARDLAALREVDLLQGPNLARWSRLAKRRFTAGKRR